MGAVTMAAAVTVVDASTALSDFDFTTTTPLAERTDLGEWVPGDLSVWGGNRRGVLDLLLAQVASPGLSALSVAFAAFAVAFACGLWPVSRCRVATVQG
jgi:hypothetical protein